MTPRNPQFEQRALAALHDQPFAAFLGMEATGAGIGWFEVRLELAPQHLQHDGIVHGGVVATLADTCLAFAALTLVAQDERIVTVEFKINYLRATQGQWLRCRGQVIRPGRTITIAEAQLFEGGRGEERLVATALGTIAVLAPLSAQG